MLNKRRRNMILSKLTWLQQRRMGSLKWVQRKKIIDLNIFKLNGLKIAEKNLRERCKWVLVVMLDRNKN